MIEEEENEELCTSVSPHGNTCWLVKNHGGRHEIQHMMGSEDWDDEGNTNYDPAY